MKKRRVLCGHCHTVLREKLTNWPWGRRWKVYYPKGCPCILSCDTDGNWTVTNVPQGSTPPAFIIKLNSLGF